MFFCSRVTAVDRHGSVSEADSEEENEEGDYTVYECPGLAPVCKIRLHSEFDGFELT